MTAQYAVGRETAHCAHGVRMANHLRHVSSCRAHHIRCCALCRPGVHGDACGEDGGGELGGPVERGACSSPSQEIISDPGGLVGGEGSAGGGGSGASEIS